MCDAVNDESMTQKCRVCIGDALNDGEYQHMTQDFIEQYEKVTQTKVSKIQNFKLNYLSHFLPFPSSTNRPIYQIKFATHACMI